MRITSSRRFKNAYHVYEHKNNFKKTLYDRNAKHKLFIC